MRLYTLLAAIFCLAAAGANAIEGAEAAELVKDPGFVNGVEVLDPKPGKAVPRGRLQPPWAKGAPEWQLKQWSSRFSLAGKAAELSGGQATFRDEAKQVVFGKPGTPDAALRLGLDSRKEWVDGERKPGEPWPHLLVGQSIAERCPPLSEITALPFTISARLEHGERFEPPTYNTHVHAAEFTVFITVQIRNPELEGHGDFLWFGIPLYDDRYPMTPRREIPGDAGHGKFIFSPGLAPYSDTSLHGQTWVSVERDLWPLVQEALEEAWKRDFLPGSRDLADYKLGSLGFGWEVPGVNHVRMHVRGLSLRAETKS